ncbi:BadM/Rrf2 family transcriptional regulator [Rubrivivax gelatinosus]|uniref:BadM/Rrf2 family transcriptional regulator n=1 Tax=Rubrivivax gelatinosus TaxID=28068 RepID=A0ABS1DW72_RUBGE|nr:Rrf2 family transcriptional regulator [Rubrivivax gelatinosus]MBK1615998.1 BadM/Rrf2 family transcriptional regulator [Rubrivivax gelatinosus]MBK1713909.1 BadM/Rrf2 family transcriptional regulator [Rubrivivax gelatinosus]
MKLTSFTDYSLRVLIYLATRPGRRATIGEIAACFSASENHLTKVVHFLATEGVLATVRGKGGGLGLARPAEAIVVGDIVRRTEGEAMPAECFGSGGGCVIAPSCRLRGVLGEAVDAFYAVLDRYTLEDLVANRDQLDLILRIGQPPRPFAAELPA